MKVLEDRRLGRGKCHKSKNEERRMSNILSFYVFCNFLNSLERLRNSLEKLCCFLTGQKVKDPGPVQAEITPAIYTSSFIRSRHEKRIISLETKKILILWYQISHFHLKKERSRRGEKNIVWVGWPVETRNSEWHLRELLPVTRLNFATWWTSACCS